MSITEVMGFFRISEETIKYAMRTGRIAATQACWHGKWRIPLAEVKRLTREGTHELLSRYARPTSRPGRKPRRRHSGKGSR